VRWSSLTCGAALGALVIMTAGAPVAEARTSAVASGSVSPATAPQLHVSGNKLVNQDGQKVILNGVDRSGGEFSCVNDTGMWDGPMNQSSITAMKFWGVTAVRVPLNEACWNGESYVNPAYAGANYQSAVRAYVSLLNHNGIVAILDLHWSDGLYTGPSSGCASAEAVCQKPMPDAAQSIPFWHSVASTFAGNNAVIFDLFNEPYPDSAASSETEGWTCWEDGGTCTGIPYQVAGMQTLVNTVRQAGAANVLMLGGLSYSSDLTQWLQHEPTDPDHNLTASWHSYNFGGCSTRACWTSEIAPVMAKVPVITGELGENDCADDYIDPLLRWLDAHSSSYLAWSWDTWSCSGGPALISSYDGAPTAYGLGYLLHIFALRYLRPVQPLT